MPRDIQFAAVNGNMNFLCLDHVRSRNADIAGAHPQRPCAIEYALVEYGVESGEVR